MNEPAGESRAKGVGVVSTEMSFLKAEDLVSFSIVFDVGDNVGSADVGGGAVSILREGSEILGEKVIVR